MKFNFFKAISIFSFFLLTGFIAPYGAFAQERIAAENSDVQMKREKMAWSDYNKDVDTRYEKIMAQVDRMKEKMQSMKMADPNFRKALTRFETKANALHERMEKSGSVPVDKQVQYRKKMKSELSKLHKEYERLYSKWQQIAG